MIMILNAAHKCPSVGQFFPPFVSRHYSYLRDVYPKLVPLLTFMEVGSAQSSRDLTSESQHLMDSRPTIEYLLNRVKDIKSSPSGIKTGWFFNIKASHWKLLSIRHLGTILKDSLQPFLFLRCSWAHQMLKGFTYAWLNIVQLFTSLNQLDTVGGLTGDVAEIVWIWVSLWKLYERMKSDKGWKF